jgi:hypothetical protein
MNWQKLPPKAALHVPLLLLDNLPQSQAAVKMQIKLSATTSWRERWQSSKHGRRLRQFDATAPGLRTQQLYRGLSRPAGSLFTQL